MKLDSWRLDKARMDSASELGESICEMADVHRPPVDPLVVAESEKERLSTFGDDFGDAFDGRLEYQPPNFLLFYNVKYDAWPHPGAHHPKVRFTIAHELGHFYLDAHRNYLSKGGTPHASLTEFSSDHIVEREADAFAAGLLMPRFLLNKTVSQQPPTLELVKAARARFDVSLTSMMVRWIQLSDFPCAVVAVAGGSIRWGFTSDAFKEAGGYSVLKGESVSSPAALNFVHKDPSLARYREGQGWGGADHWMHISAGNIDVKEEYTVVPSLGLCLVLLAADEKDVFPDLDEEQ